jgi:serine-type D-Ala-D-Ala endopeptidase (penicillin-binding protein 7)
MNSLIRPSRTIFSFALLMAAVVTIVVLCIPVGTHAATKIASGETIQQKGVLMKFSDSVEVHVPRGATSSDISVSLESVGTFAERADLPRPTKGLAGFGEVYAYTLSTSVVNKAVIELPVTPINAKQQNNQWTVMHRGESGEWRALKTIENHTDNVVRTVVPSKEGMLIVAYHKTIAAKPRPALQQRSYTGRKDSAAASVLDVDSGTFLYKRNANARRSIASISKLMTVYTYKQKQANENATVTYRVDASRAGAVVRLNDHEQISSKQALMGTLLQSANNMAVTLSRSTSLSEKQFMSAMNTNARKLKLKQTRFVEPSGLNPQNVSSAADVSRMARAAFAQDPELYREVSQTRVYHYITRNTQRDIYLYTTNKFNGRGRFDVEAFKTGYLPGSADRTLVIQLKERATGKRIIVTLLGNPRYGTIFDEAYALAEWSVSNWEFPTHASF